MRKDWTWPTEALAGVVSGLKVLGPEVSQEICDQWWQTFLPGFIARDIGQSIFVFAKTVQVKMMLKAEVHYSRQQQEGVPGMGPDLPGRAPLDVQPCPPVGPDGGPLWQCGDHHP